MNPNKPNPFASSKLWLCPILVWAIFSIAPSLSYAQEKDSTFQISLVTIGPGNDLYSGFGHSLFWVSHPSKGIDATYNYGTFSFQTGNFYIKFLRGTLPYSLSKTRFGPLASHYQYEENRSVSLQTLNLTDAQKSKLYALLEENYRPENREYSYRFFYDNCATRLQDMLIAACGDSLRYTGYTAESRTFREWIDQYAYRQKPWADFGMDLAIGKPADKLATPMEATFLPDNLRDAFADAEVVVSGKTEPLVSANHVLYTATPEPGPGFFTPMVTFWLLALAMGLLTWWQLRSERINFLPDKILFNLCAIAGVILLLLWFGTNHEDTARNWDVLWANPLLFFVAAGISSKTKKPWISVLLIIYALFLLAGTINLDKHNQVLIPILLTLIIRLYYINTAMAKIKES